MVGFDTPAAEGQAEPETRSIGASLLEGILLTVLPVEAGVFATSSSRFAARKWSSIVIIGASAWNGRGPPHHARDRLRNARNMRKVVNVGSHARAKPVVVQNSTARNHRENDTPQAIGRCLVSHSSPLTIRLRSFHERIPPVGDEQLGGAPIMFKLVATMRRGSASDLAAAWARYPTIEAARLGTATLLRDERILRVMIVRNEIPPAFVEWAER